VTVANVYIDGFNLFYGQLKGNLGVKWLNPVTMSELLLPGEQINRVRYFTARVRRRPQDPQIHVRQDAYLRALHTLPKVTVHEGQFFANAARMPLARPRLGGPRFADVIKTEEKGSDVNLATYLLVDAFRNDANTFVVVSNDSDLTEPLRIVRHELGKRIGLLNPHPTPSLALQRCGPSFTRPVRQGVLVGSQLPNVVLYTKPDGSQGKITKPTGW
jgi:NYN domain